MKHFIFSAAMMAALIALPSYGADGPQRTSLSKSIEPSLKQWEPISVLEQDGQIYIQLPQKKITDPIYSSVIEAGLCLGKAFNPELDWSDIKTVSILNEEKIQGFTFNGGEKECEAINNTKMGDTSPLIKERKTSFKGLVVSPDQQNIGQWRVGSERSKIDDSTNIVLNLDADYPYTNDLGQSVTPTLFIRCMENKTALGVDWKTFLNIDDMPVLQRMDKEKAQTTKWSIASNNTAAFAPSPISFIRALMEHDKLLLQVTPHGANKVTAEFYVNGLKDAILPVQEACNWK